MGYGYGWSGTKARNTEYPRSYSEAAQYIASGRNPNSRKLPGTATEVRRVELYGYVDGSYGQIGTAYAVRYHNTDVLTWYEDGSFKLATGGWDTATTAIKMNACLPNGYRVASVKYTLVVWGPSLGEGEQDRTADGFTAHPTAEQWAEDAVYWQERRDAIAAREIEDKRRREEYIANGSKPHTARIYAYGEYETPLEVAGPFPTRHDAEQWGSERIEALLTVYAAQSGNHYNRWAYHCHTELAEAAIEVAS